MKKSVVVYFLILFPVTLLFSEVLIPRRVLYAEKNTPIDGASNFPVLPLLNARLNDYNSVIPVKQGERYHYIITVEYDEDSLTFILEDLNGQINSGSYKIDGTLESIEKACSAVAESWKKYLGPAKPFTEDIFLQEKQNMEKEASFDESLSTKYRISYWITAARTAEDMEKIAPVYGYFFPNTIDFDWFYAPTWGCSLSLYWDYSDFMVFEFTNGVKSHAFSNTLLLGAGISFRTLGRLSGNYGFTYYLGSVQADIIDDQDNVVSEETLTYPLFAMRSGISYNFNKSFSAGLRLVAYISPDAFTQSGISANLDTGSLFHADLQAGAGFKW